jgi:hypothetical protein
MIRIKRSVNVLPESVIFVMSKSKSLNTSPAPVDILNMPLIVVSQTLRSPTISLPKISQEDKDSNLLACPLFIKACNQVIQEREVPNTIPSNESMVMVGMVRVTALLVHINILWRIVIESKRTLFSGG